jgi:hypothetical protein
VRAPERTAEAVLQALETGAFYSSAGPLLHEVRRDGDVVAVRCSPCRAVTLVSGKSIGAAVNAGRLGYRHAGEIVREDEGGLVVEARLTIPPAARHVRVEVTDTLGRKAWANPVAV